MLNYRRNANTKNIKVYYEDNHLLVLFKPSGILIQGDSTNEVSMVDIGRKYLALKYNKKGNVFLSPTHRLDKPASGLVIFARTSKSASRVTKQFRDNEITKIYNAIVEGEIDTKSPKTIKNYIIRKDSKTYITNDKSDDSKYAEMKYKLLSTKNNLSLIEIELITGRKHQIRAQISNEGFPVLGDIKYSSKMWNEGIKKGIIKDTNSIALLSKEISFYHPITKDKMTVSCDLPKEWNL